MNKWQQGRQGTEENKELIRELLHVREDIICGLHSGFPPCCIKFFITKWIWNLGSRSYQEHWKKIRRVRSFEIQYIPCPKCLKNKTFVHLKKCPKNCPKLKLVKKYFNENKKAEQRVRKEGTKATTRDSKNIRRR